MFLESELEKAIKSGKYLITISYQSNSSGKNDLQHSWFTKNYPKGSLIDTMNHIKNDIYSKEIGGNLFMSPNSNQHTRQFIERK